MISSQLQNSKLSYIFQVRKACFKKTPSLIQSIELCMEL